MAVAAELPHYELITETVADNFAIKVTARAAVLLTLLSSLCLSFASSISLSPLRLPALIRFMGAIRLFPTRGLRGSCWTIARTNVCSCNGLIWFRTVMKLTALRRNQSRSPCFPMHGENFKNRKKNCFFFSKIRSILFNQIKWCVCKIYSAISSFKE